MCKFFLSLKQLQNRGYNPTGICYIRDGDFSCHKCASNENDSALDKIEKI